MTEMQSYLAAVPADRREYQRDMLRRKAAKYRRDVRDLLNWTYPESRATVMMSEVCPHDPAYTSMLCHRLYRDLQTARAMPTFFRRRAARIEVLRELFACECELFRNQRASVNAQRGMNDFINGLGVTP